MALTRLLKKGIITLTCTAASLAAKDALAQGFDNKQNWDRPVQSEPAREPAQLEKTLELQIQDAGLWAKGNHSPTEHGVTLSAYLTLRSEDLRPGITALSSWQEYDNNTPLEITTNRILANLGAFLQRKEDFELFVRPAIGYENTHFSRAISLDANSFKIGADVGMANPQKGTTVVLGVHGGIGNYDAELLSNFENDGQYSTFFTGLKATQRIFGENKKAMKVSEFDRINLGEEFRYSLHASIEAFLRNDKLGELQDSTGTGIRISLPNVLNLREYGRDAKGNIYAKGAYFTFTPFAEAQKYDTESGLSITKTTSNRYRLGITAEMQIGEYVGVFVEGGYQWYRLDTNGNTTSKDGFAGAVGLIIRK